MDIIKLILRLLRENKGGIRASDVVKAAGFSRAYINRFFQQLQAEGKIILVGKANKARYITADRKALLNAKKNIKSARRILRNKNLAEDLVLKDIKEGTGIFFGLPKSVSDIAEYAFLEMLNNAIEHSGSKKIEVMIEKRGDGVRFNVVDKGMGIFNNIMEKKHLGSEMEAIQDLLKGKQSTLPRTHSGEGIFFTSKAADMLIIQSSIKKLIFNNIINDIFIKDVKNTVGTKVAFYINLTSKNNLARVFKSYSDNSFEFNKTSMVVKLYKMDSEYISRSQARRILSGLENFRTIVLDFKNVKMIGQGFADEIFRVWQSQHPAINIISKNAEENALFMINRAKGAPVK